MLNIRFVRENSTLVKERLSIRGFDSSTIVDQILALDITKRESETSLNSLSSQQKILANQIGELMKKGDREDAEEIKSEVASLKEQAKELNQIFESSSQELEELLLLLPNIPHHSVPAGMTAQQNEIVKEGGKIPLLEDALPHWELATKYNLIDFETGAKITGAGFPLFKGKGAKLQRALIAYFLDFNIEAGYSEVIPPYMVNEASAYGTGQLPDKGEQMYHLGLDNFFMIPTAEVPVTNIFRDSILSQEELPVKVTAYSPCFRREAGSYGKDVRGLNRLHQFDKVEVVQIAHPESSYQILEEMVGHVERLILSLGLPYRILRLCGGDMGFTSALTYDFEVYSAAQKRWLEVSSVSNFETFQSNRLKLRFRDLSGKIEPAHTLNGSSLALPRIIAALLENYQEEERIAIPSVLVPYTKFDYIF
ncbi:MAG: serine--tRNA ligase [Bacteroidales bacterium]